MDVKERDLKDLLGKERIHDQCLQLANGFFFSSALQIHLHLCMSLHILEYETLSAGSGREVLGASS